MNLFLSVEIEETVAASPQSSPLPVVPPQINPNFRRDVASDFVRSQEFAAGRQRNDLKFIAANPYW
jgi:hypothetical protein